VAVFLGDASARLGTVFSGDLVEFRPDTTDAKVEKCRI